MTQPAQPEQALRSALNDAIMASGANRADVARAADMSEGSLRRHLDGEGGLSVFAFLSIADAVNVDALALLNEVGIT